MHPLPASLQAAQRPAIPLPRAGSRPALAARRQGSASLGGAWGGMPLRQGGAAGSGLRRQGSNNMSPAAVGSHLPQRQPSNSSFSLLHQGAGAAPVVEWEGEAPLPGAGDAAAEQHGD